MSRGPSLDDVILAAQDERGAFASFVASAGREIDDRNGFITALVVRTLGHGQLPHRLHHARQRALDYLERCERRGAPGTFGFWPEEDRPPWAPDLPADADDTAVIALELHRAGRRPLDWLRRVALTVLLPFRVAAPEIESEPAWIRPGVFRTWLAHRLPNPVDCVVNVNVMALLASAGLAHIAAYRSASGMMDAALDWTGAPGGDRAVLRAPHRAALGAHARDRLGGERPAACAGTRDGVGTFRTAARSRSAGVLLGLRRGHVAIAGSAGRAPGADGFD